MKQQPQAERATPAQVSLHIRRQRKLGSLMIGDHDQPTRLDWFCAGVVVGMAIFSKVLEWMP